ncbi:XRE family transcriptional regulator [Acidovorax sp. NCPPB 2350]|nr:XRE family transcriptional regulator [Acidovorax sp. NCPPB 2350]
MPRQNTHPADYPQAVLRQIEQLAQNITIARKRRGETQAQWAKKLGVSQPTMARIERGDPSVAMASYVMCLWLVNQAEGLADLIAPASDHAALEREVAKARAGRKPAEPRRSTKTPAPPAPLREPPLPAAAGADRGAYTPAAPPAPPATVREGSAPARAPAARLKNSAARLANDNAAGLAALLHRPDEPPPT